MKCKCYRFSEVHKFSEQCDPCQRAKIKTKDGYVSVELAALMVLPADHIEPGVCDD